jgi:hypothetical protein
MKRKGNNKGSLPDFIRYIRGEMTKREENSFQRQLQRDPFAEEAAEGLSEFPAETVEKDIKKLESKIKTRISGSRRYIYFRIAASVAVLMVISSVYIISTRNRTARELSDTAAIQEPLEIPASEEIKEQPEEVSKKSNIVSSEREIEEPMIASSIEEQGGVRTEKGESAVAGGIADQPTYAEDKKLDMAEIQTTKLEPPAPSRNATITQVSGKITSAEEKISIPAGGVMKKGAIAKVKTDTNHIFEIIVTNNTEQILYFPPAPLNGEENFELYIEENIHIPDSIPEGQTAVVLLDFIVRRTGIIDSINTVISPGPEFSEEAIRLIKAGPAWNPAEENGRAIDDEVRIRIVFYKNNDKE